MRQSLIRNLRGTRKFSKVKVTNCSLKTIMYELKKYVYINTKRKLKTITNDECSTSNISTTNCCTTLCVTNTNFIG